MREIKFRAKHKVLGWKYGTVLYTANDDMWQLVDDNSVFYEINRETLGQFTGLYDKNKVPIYEGDIVKKPEWMGCYDEEICLCIYNQENNTSPVIGFGLYAKSKLTGRYQDLVESDEWDECEVIGNIYDDSGLLGE